MAIIMAWTTDLEEQLVITGVQIYSCPVCLTSHQDLGHWQGAVNHTPCKAKITISETHQVCELHPEASTFEFKNEMLKWGNGLSGAVEDFCWKDPPIGPDIFITQDLLHSCYKFVWDHVFEWLVHTIGKEELNCHFSLSQSSGSRTSQMGSQNYLKLLDVNIEHI